MLTLAAPTILLLTGCSGSVDVGGDVEDFGALASAIWFHYDAGVGSPPGGAHEEYDEIVLSNVGDLCTKTQDLWVQEAKTAEAISGVDDPDRRCAELEDAYNAYFSAEDAIYHEGSHFFTLYIGDGSVPQEQTYSADLEHIVQYYADSPYAEMIADYDVAGTSADCIGNFDESVDRWDVRSDTEFQVTRVTDGKSLAAKLDEGELVYVSGDGKPGTGTISAAFTAQWCEVE